MTIFTKTRLGLGAAVATAALAAAVPLAAPASASTSQCDYGRMCIWQYGDATGMYGSFAKGTSDLGVALGGKMDDKASYVYNHDSEPWCVYQYKNQGGHAMMVPAGKKASIVNIIDPRDGFTWDNRVSSLRPALHFVPPRNPGAAYYACQGDYIVLR
ncbi:peptidase inhibitor family I36 protein [Phycicoccus sonneratiae]|uniref:Peptidase inhibitor family I36 protein n=1 Tax=Phycicoccus sonneratiae TaxID=2807628 RepID=A0ABS2CHB7_9MICO|nr:peptidase inhibitor family I36 protein [Phycicoccus sonneraticus]MBM6399175.1 peptidase inhibitor family I36 protein [Phycicoccus sonneraticus]